MNIREIAENAAVAMTVIFGLSFYVVIVAVLLSIPAGIAWVLYALGVFLIGG